MDFLSSASKVIFWPFVATTPVAPPEPISLEKLLNVPERVVTLDGGGMRGLYSIKVLEAVEDKLNGSLVDHVDCMVGTSTGSILAYGLASGRSLQDTEKLYKEEGSRIFSKSIFQEIESLDGWIAPQYDPESLEKVLQDFFGQQTIGRLSKVGTLSFATDITSQTLVPFNSYTIRKGKEEDTEVWKAIRSSTAAPTYFPPFNHNGHAWCDGGLVVNNPSYVATDFLKAQCGDEAFKKLKLVSVGTGIFPTGITYSSGKSMGDAQWADPISDTMLKCQTNMFESMTELRLGSDRYVRLNSILKKNIPLDGITKQDLDDTEEAALEFIKNNPEKIDKAAKLLS